MTFAYFETSEVGSPVLFIWPKRFFPDRTRWSGQDTFAYTKEAYSSVCYIWAIRIISLFFIYLPGQKVSGPDRRLLSG